MNKKRVIFLVYIALALVTIAGFLRIGANEFIDFDDVLYITDNPNVNGGLNLKSAIWAFTDTYASNWHPLTWISHMLDCQLFGLEPAGHHFTNLLLHTVNTLLLLWVLHTAAGKFWPAAFVAACFALHPMDVGCGQSI